MRTTFTYNGLFIPESGSGSGHLELSGARTTLTRVGHEEDEHPDDIAFDIHGHLVDGQKASLLECIRSGYSINYQENKRQIKDNIFPHYVLTGNRFLKSDEEIIKSIRFHSKSFFSFSTGASFSCNFSDRQLTQYVLRHTHEEQKNNLSKSKKITPASTKIGEHPVLYCYNGQIEIASCQSKVGKITLENSPIYGIGSPNGISLENQITARIDFNDTKNFRDCIKQFIIFQNFLELVFGDSIYFEWIEVEISPICSKEDALPNDRLDVYWSYAHDIDESPAADKPRHSTLMIPELHPDEFKAVAAEWMNGPKALQQARGRNSIESRHVYGPDRLIGAANKFDLLPDTHAPKKIKLSKAEGDAVNECKRLFKALPDSFARQSVLSALGRVGSASLRDKILHRALVITSVTNGHFEDIELACSEAVICRNHFVHGSLASLDYSNEFEIFSFLTDTLEFVFGASDLIEQGWHFERWRENYRDVGHPFGAYTTYFGVRLNMLKSLLGRARPAVRPF